MYKQQNCYIEILCPLFTLVHALANPIDLRGIHRARSSYTLFYINPGVSSPDYAISLNKCQPSIFCNKSKSTLHSFRSGYTRCTRFWRDPLYGRVSSLDYAIRLNKCQPSIFLNNNKSIVHSFWSVYIVYTVLAGPPLGRAPCCGLLYQSELAASLYIQQQK